MLILERYYIPWIFVCLNQKLQANSKKNNIDLDSHIVMEHLTAIKNIERKANTFFRKYWREYFSTLNFCTSKVTFFKNPIDW